MAARPDEGASNQFWVRKHPPHPSLPRSRLRLRGMGIQRQPPQTTWGRGDATRRHVGKYATLKLTLRVVESGTKVSANGREPCGTSFLYRQVDACRSPIVSLITAGSIHGEQVTRQPIVLAACASSTITPLGIFKTPFRGLSFGQFASVAFKKYWHDRVLIKRPQFAVLRTTHQTNG